MVPFLDLKAQYQTIKDEIHSALQTVLESCQFALGREVAAFETEFGNYCGARHAVAVNSGTSALHLALLAADIGPGDEVITTPMTFVATVAAIRYTGARPVFVDCDPAYYNIDGSKIAAAVTEKTKAIVPVHLYGQPADMDSILETAQRHNLTVIEDAAQAHGAEYKGRRAGSIGDLGCFSFYPGKNLGAYGEGGCVVSNNEQLAEKVRMMRDWGQRKKSEHILPGFNYRMDGFQGAVLRVKLRYLEQWTEARRRNAARYSELLSDSGVTVPAVSPDVRHVYHIYALLSAKRDAIQTALGEREIQSGKHYPDPVHLLPVHGDLGYQVGDFPVAEQVAREELSLPMFAELTPEQVERVADGVKNALEGGA